MSAERREATPGDWYYASDGIARGAAVASQSPGVPSKKRIGEALHTAAAQNAINAACAPVSSPETCCCSWGFLWRVPDEPTGRQQSDRIMAMVIDGLRPGEST